MIDAGKFNDSFRMTQAYFSRYSDGYHLAMVVIYFDRLGAQSGFQKYSLIHMIHDSFSFFRKYLTCSG